MTAVPDEFEPGIWRCAKCGFVLIQSILDARTCEVTVRDDPGEKCPNDGAPLWRVTRAWWQADQDRLRREQELRDDTPAGRSV